jgi:hypothetical protein|tara:strand:+ start:785 stop:1498 length:714 start_codon:yes stop_codon:yes gene_type:complete
MKNAKANYYSTWDFIDSYNERRLKEKLHKNESLLETDYSLLATHSDKVPYKNDFILYKDSEKLPPIKSFLAYFEFGVYPPPSIIAAVAESFNQYYFKGGGVTLEECFFGDLSKSIGNDAARDKRNTPFNYMFIICNDESSELSQVEAAEQTIEKLNLECDVDTFLRQYRRFKVDKNLIDLKTLKRKSLSLSKIQSIYDVIEDLELEDDVDTFSWLYRLLLVSNSLDIKIIKNKYNKI